MASVALFEDSSWQSFFPITLTRPTFDVKIGARSYYEEYAHPPEFLLTREYLAATTRLRHTSSLVNPHSIDEDTLFVNGLLHPGSVDFNKFSNISHTFIVTSGNRLLLGRLGRRGGEYVASCAETGKKINLKNLDTEKSTDVGMQNAQGLMSNPWELIVNLENSLSMQITGTGSTASSSIPAGVKTLGQGPVIIQDAEVEEGTVLDTTKGGIFIGSQTHIAPSRIVGPSFIDRMTQVKQFTIIEASFIGYNCRISGEVEHSVVSDYTNKAHTGFLGHSYVGEWVNLGAMTTTSDLKMTYGNIKMHNGASDGIVDTGTNKMGSFIGDMCKTSIGTLIYSGRRLGVSSNLHGLVAGDVPSFTIYGSSIGASNVELQLDSAIETQRKVMSRRNQRISKAYEEMMKYVFSMTAPERKKNKVRKAKFRI